MTLTVGGLTATVTIRRDAHGVAHIDAETESDAWFGQGFVAAQDRLWQMEYDRRRAYGRWSELAGKTALAADVLARRLQLARSARADAAALSPDTRRMFAAYSAGVNAYLTSGEPLPPECAATNTTPAPWTPIDACAVFKIRHVLMGVWQKKLAQAQLLARVGPEAYARLDGRPPVGSAVILPPDAGARRTFEVSAQEMETAARQLGFLAAAEGGSNSWALHGSRTTTGMPVLCNDSHRALDVPSVYWQVHVSCPEFDVIGAAFPGMPGFPHFAHNATVAWNITHTSADYQDLYLERLDRTGNYLTRDGWRPLERTHETIHVSGADPVEVALFRTHHGPIVHGPFADPDDAGRELAISLRYTATEEPNRGFECLRPMLLAKTVPALFETQRGWVDPVNNLVAADTQGTIGYLTRGYLPIRSSPAHRQFPAPGWDGQNEWTGRVAHDRLPQEVTPSVGFIATANQQVIPGEDPFISHDFAAPSRAERIRELIHSTGERGDRDAPKHSPAEIAAWQADVTSRPARTWGAFLARVGPYAEDAERARRALASFDGALLATSSQAFLYGYFRRSIAHALFEPIVGPDTWRWITGTDVTAVHAIITRCMANVVASLEAASGSSAAVNGRPWDDVLQRALSAAWRTATEAGGPDRSSWRWGDRHTTNARHPLAARFPDRAKTQSWNPPRVPMGGDGDTLQAASYLWRDTTDFDVVGLSVYRQVVDLSDIAGASFVIPGGASADPTSPHYQDQLPVWSRHERIPMHYGAAAVRAAAVETLTLVPA